MIFEKPVSRFGTAGLLLFAALFFVASAYAEPTSSCKIRKDPTDGSPHYTNSDLTRPGGRGIDQNCLDAFLDVIRAGNPRPAHLTYDLPSRDLFPTIRELLDASNAAGVKLEIRFYLPSEESSDPTELTQVRVYFLPAPKSQDLR